MTKHRTHLTLLIMPVALIVLFSGNGIHADKSFIDELKERLIQYNRDYHVEKTFLMTDRFVYRPGDDLWFKGFVVSSGLQQMQSYSHDFFIKLLNSKGEEVTYRRYPLTDNQTGGRLLIPRTSIPGRYWLVAYTGWMKNQCSQEAFRKEILISKYFEKRFKIEVLYDKVVYYPHDTVNANIKILDPAGKPITEADFDYSIGSYLKQDIKGSGKTDIRGFSKISCNIQDSEEIQMLTIEIRSRKLSGDYTIIIPTTGVEPTVTFFPEGGNLVYGLKNNMALSVVNNSGQPAVVSGEITDHHGNVLRKIWTDATGKAKFEYKPTEDTCFLRIIKPKNISKKYPLPIANVRGLVMSLVESDGDSAKFRITASEDQALTVSHWVAVMDRQVVWSKSVYFMQSELVSIPIKDLKSGLLQVSVFNQDHILVNERLLNIRHSTGQISIKTDHQVYHNRQRVNVLIEYPGNLSKVDLALSVALRDLSYHSMMTDFKGIRMSTSCDSNRFNFRGRNLVRDIDLMTSNYRNVYWNDLFLADGTKPAYTRHDGLNGLVLDRRENISQHAKVRVTHMPNYRTFETQSDENGTFQVAFGSDIIDFNYLNIDAYDAMGKVNLTARIDQTYVEELRTTIITESENNEKQKTEDVLTYGEPDLIYVLRYGPGKFRKSVGEAKKKYDPNQYADYTDVLDIIQEIQPYRLDNNIIIFTNPEDTNLQPISYEGAIIVINGALKGNNADVLKNLLPSDITNINISTSLLDVHKYTPLNFMGVIEITTIQGLYRYRQPAFQIGMDVLNVDREFYSPDYSVESTTSGDNRKTLYWNPKLRSDPGKPLLISFYTSDIKGVFYGRLAGLDDSGNPVESEFSFTVE